MGCGVAGWGAWWQMATDTLLPCHSQEAAERESKLLRDLSAANEKNPTLRNQVWVGWEWGCSPGKPGVGREQNAKPLPPVPTLQVDELERKVKSQQEQLFPDQNGADQHDG